MQTVCTNIQLSPRHGGCINQGAMFQQFLFQLQLLPLKLFICCQILVFQSQHHYNEKGCVFSVALPCITAILLQGCGSITMEANSKMTNSIFFKNIQPKKTAFIVAKNSSPVDSELGNQVKQKLQNRGYMLMDNPDTAQYIVQVNALNMNEEHEQKALKTATAAGATTAIVSYAVNHSGKDALGSGLAVGAVAGLFAYATADGHVRMQADVLITEKLADNKTIEEVWQKLREEKGDKSAKNQKGAESDLALHPPFSIIGAYFTEPY